MTAAVIPVLVNFDSRKIRSVLPRWTHWSTGVVKHWISSSKWYPGLCMCRFKGLADFGIPSNPMWVWKIQVQTWQNKQTRRPTRHMCPNVDQLTLCHSQVPSTFQHIRTLSKVHCLQVVPHKSLIPSKVEIEQLCQVGMPSSQPRPWTWKINVFHWHLDLHAMLHWIYMPVLHAAWVRVWPGKLEIEPQLVRWSILLRDVNSVKFQGPIRSWVTLLNWSLQHVQISKVQAQVRVMRGSTGRGWANP